MASPPFRSSSARSSGKRRSSATVLARLARTQAQSARNAIEASSARLDWKRCKTDGPGRTKLPGCRKLYIPLGNKGPSEAPYGFVFQLIQKPDDSLAWNLIAFGERHPANERTSNVYERAHKRLHGRYP